MGISTKIITNFSHLLELESAWNRELVTSVENPFLYSRLFGGFMHFWDAKGWTPLVFTFWCNNRIVGMAPLKIRKSFYLNYVCNLSNNVYSDFVFLDEYRESCMTRLIDVLFNCLNCRSAAITLQNDSPNLKTLEKVCQTKGLHFWKAPYAGRAIIPVKHDWDLFYNSLKGRVRKKLRKMKRNLDSLGSWRIFCVGVDSNSVEKIFAVERTSWKNKWRAQNKLQEDYILRIILNASQPKGEVEPIYESEVWFLEVDGLAIAYRLVLVYKGTASFVKTSYNAQFKKFSSGKFLMNVAIRETFKKRNVKKIDFITNLLVVQI